MNKALIILACMLAVPLLAKLPSAKIRAISKAIRAKDVNAFAAVFAEHGLDVNSVLMPGGYTILHEAAAQRSPEIVEYLIAQDVEVNVVNEYGYTPLDEAIAFGDADTVALLEAAGATHGEGFRIKTAPTARIKTAPTAVFPEHDIIDRGIWSRAIIYSSF